MLVRRRTLLGWLAGTAAFDVRELSRGGLSFESDQPFEVGTEVRLWLKVRQWCQPMELVAKVSAVRSVYKGAHLVSVNFQPFGEGSNDNPPEALLALARLEAKHVAA